MPRHSQNGAVWTPSTKSNISIKINLHFLISLLFSLNMSFTHRNRVVFNLIFFSSRLFFNLYCFQSTRKNTKNPILFIISSVFTQHIFQSTLIPLYMCFNLHHLHSAMAIICIEFSLHFITSRLFFNLKPNFNHHCFSITYFIFSLNWFSISIDFQST